MSGASRRLSASARVLLAMTGVLALAIVLLVAVAYVVTTRALTADIDRTLRREADAYAAAVRSAPATEALTQATRSYLAARTSRGSGRDVILLVSLGGRTISNSRLRLEDAPGNDLRTGRPALRYDSFRYDGTSYRALIVPVSAGDGASGVFEAAVDARAANATATRVAYALGAAGLLVLAFGLPLSYWATRRSLRPLTRMAEDATEVSHAQPGRRIDYDGPPDELGSLARALNAMLDRLERAYEDQRRFVADASHELRTPVAVIRGNVEILRSGAAQGDDAEESLEMIESEAVRMAKLLDELLALARFESAHRTGFQPLEVRSLLDDVAARARRLGDRAITVEGDCGLWVEADPDLIDQALMNLVRNAIAHTNQHGSVTFACDRTASTVRVSVTDDGPGIPVEDLDRVFDRFYRAQGARPVVDAGSGAGLGLAITRRIVELHGGTIRAENASGAGARFTLELPSVSEPPES